LCGGDKPYLKPKMLEHEHTLILGFAVESFRQIPKMGGDEFSSSYLKKLQSDLNDAFESFKEVNETKKCMVIYFLKAEKAVGGIAGGGIYWVLLQCPLEW
jgi:hypothetical protein